MQETQVLSLGWEDPLHEEMATPIFLFGKFHGQKRLVGYSSWGRKRVRHNLAIKHQTREWRKDLAFEVLQRERFPNR